MKRTLLVLTSLLAVVLVLFPAQALAEEGSVLIRVETADGAADGVVDIPILLEGCEGVDSVQFDLNYDGAALSFVSMTPGDLFAAEYTVFNAEVPGRIRVACAGALGLTGPGTLMTLRFRALNDVGSAMTVTSGIVTRVDAEYVQSEAYVSVENGGVTIDGAPLPEPAVTPWVPRTPVPALTPTPEPTPGATPEPTATASPVAAAPTSLGNIPPKALIVIGALVLLAFVLIVSLLAAKRRKRAGTDKTDR
ncbi:MAG: hypothetical protein GX417_06610 [Clostridiales bacterium]|nr:hypothetical protein [Clostridiales bacterium]